MAAWGDFHVVNDNVCPTPHGLGYTQPNKAFSHLRGPSVAHWASTVGSTKVPSSRLMSGIPPGVKTLKLLPQWLTPTAPKPVPLALPATLLAAQHPWLACEASLRSAPTPPFSLLLFHPFPWFSSYLSPSHSFCLLCLNSSSIYSWNFRISFWIIHGFALFANYFLDAMYYTSFIVPTELRMKLVSLVPVGSRVECQKQDVVLQISPPVVLTHFFAGGGLSFSFTNHCFIHEGAPTYTGKSIWGKWDHFPDDGEAFPSFPRKSSLMASSLPPKKRDWHHICVGKAWQRKTSCTVSSWLSLCSIRGSPALSRGGDGLRENACLIQAKFRQKPKEEGCWATRSNGGDLPSGFKVSQESSLPKWEDRGKGPEQQWDVCAGWTRRQELLRVWT